MQNVLQQCHKLMQRNVAWKKLKSSDCAAKFLLKPLPLRKVLELHVYFGLNNVNFHRFKHLTM